MGTSKRLYRRAFKFSVVRQVNSAEKSPKEACQEHHLASRVLARWRKEYRQLAEAAFPPWWCQSPLSRTVRGPAPASLSSNTSSESRIIQLEIKAAELQRFCGRLAMENFLFPQALSQATQRQGITRLSPSA